MKKKAETGRRLLGYAGQHRKAARNVDHDRLEAQRDRRYRLAELGACVLEVLRHPYQGMPADTRLEHQVREITESADALGLLEGEGEP